MQWGILQLSHYVSLITYVACSSKTHNQPSSYVRKALNCSFLCKVLLRGFDQIQNLINVYLIMQMNDCYLKLAKPLKFLHCINVPTKRSVTFKKLKCYYISSSRMIVKKTKSSLWIIFASLILSNFFLLDQKRISWL